MANQPPNREWHGAHHSWSYSQTCFRWLGPETAGANLLPLAAEMRAWLGQRGLLSLAPEADKGGKGGYTNPYTLSGAALGMVLGRVVNAWHEYVTSQAEGHDAVDAEVERLRLYNELLLYTARFCEVVVKQMLHCTQIPENQFKRMALGQLLESPCPSCKKANGQQPHSVSMVGTLAHPFRLCLEFEHCAMDHMALVNKQRNSEAAHSEIQLLNVRSVAESKAHLASDCDDVLSRFSHMLSHLENLEARMIDDLTKKGAAINLLKRNGLGPEDCNFNLEPGQPVGAPRMGLLAQNSQTQA